MTAAATPRLAGSLSRPPSGHVLMFRLPILQSSHRYKDERTGYLIKDRLSFMRFLRLSLAQSVPDANSIWNSWGADAGDRGFVHALRRRADEAGFLAMGGQIIDGRSRTLCTEVHRVQNLRGECEWEAFVECAIRRPRAKLMAELGKGCERDDASNLDAGAIAATRTR